MGRRRALAAAIAAAVTLSSCSTAAAEQSSTITRTRPVTSTASTVPAATTTTTAAAPPQETTPEPPPPTAPVVESPTTTAPRLVPPPPAQPAAPPPPPTEPPPPEPPPPPPPEVQPPPPPAHDAFEAEMFELVNQLRAQAGVGPLRANRHLAQVARDHSATLPGHFAHNPNVRTQIPAGWTAWGENVAKAPTVRAAFDALVASPDHYANMVSADFSDLGAGAFSANGSVFVTQVFARY